MKQIITSAAALLLFTGAYAQTKKATPPVKGRTPSVAPINPMKTLKDSVSYAIGTQIAANLKNQNLQDINIPLLQKAIGDVMNGKQPLCSDEVAQQTIQKYMQKAQASKSVGAKAEGAKFLAMNAKRKGVVVLPSGLQYEVIKTGTDTIHPLPTNTVKCHYHGTLINGEVFDSSVERGEPASFPVNGVIKGWQEALPLMTVGSKWKLFIPSDLGYGDNGAGGKIGPGATLIFEVELIAIES